MRRSSSLTEEQRKAALACFEQGLGEKATANQLGVSRWPIKRLQDRWRVRGRGALVTKQSKTSYSYEFKLGLVRRCIAGESAVELATEAELSSPMLLRTWVRLFRNGGEDALRPKPKGRPKAVDHPPPEDDSELVRLRRENELLRARNAYLEKLRALRDEEQR